MDRIDGLAQVNLIVTDLQRATEFWQLLGWQSTPRHTNAAVITFPSGMNLVLHEPPFAQHWDPAYAGPTAGSTVIDLNLPSRQRRRRIPRPPVRGRIRQQRRTLGHLLRCPLRHHLRSGRPSRRPQEPTRPLAQLLAPGVTLLQERNQGRPSARGTRRPNRPLKGLQGFDRWARRPTTKSTSSTCPSAEKVDTFGQKTPIGRAGQPAELAPAFVFLASQESSYITGKTIAARKTPVQLKSVIFTRLGEGRRVSVNRLRSKLAAAVMLPVQPVAGWSRGVVDGRRFPEPRWSISTVMPY